MTERARWNDQAVDGLERRVDVHRDELDALRLLPATVAKLAATVESERVLAVEERNVARRFRSETRDHFERIHSDHDDARPDGINWTQFAITLVTLFLTAAAGIGLPLAIYLSTK